MPWISLSRAVLEYELLSKSKPVWQLQQTEKKIRCQGVEDWSCNRNQNDFPFFSARRLICAFRVPSSFLSKSWNEDPTTTEFSKFPVGAPVTFSQPTTKTHMDSALRFAPSPWSDRDHPVTLQSVLRCFTNGVCQKQKTQHLSSKAFLDENRSTFVIWGKILENLG